MLARNAFAPGLLCAALLAGCGGDGTIPDNGFSQPGSPPSSTDGTTAPKLTVEQVQPLDTLPAALTAESIQQSTSALEDVSGRSVYAVSFYALEADAQLDVRYFQIDGTLYSATLSWTTPAGRATASCYAPAYVPVDNPYQAPACNALPLDTVAKKLSLTSTLLRGVVADGSQTPATVTLSGIVTWPYPAPTL